MLLSAVALLVVLSVTWFLWKNRKSYFGNENRHKFFAEYFKDFPTFYNSRAGDLKKKLFESLHEIESSFPDLRKAKGLRILEIGAGSGANLEFYPKNTKLIVVDPNPFFNPHLKDNLKKFPQIELERYVVAGAEDMKDIPANSVDVVVSTLVLCSCDQLQQIYKEICRVLTPGGKFLFMEHVVDDKMSLLKFLQAFAGCTGLFQFFFDGCRPDKDIKKEIEKGGFATVDAKRFRLDGSGVPPAYWAIYMVEPHIYGVATTKK